MMVFKYFDKLEDKIRGKLTHYPLVYAFIGSIGIVSIWRGVWHISDDWGLSSFASLLIGVIISMATGLFVSFFIGENIIISGLNKEKKIDEKTEEEIHKERTTLTDIKKDIKEIKEILLRNSEKN